MFVSFSILLNIKNAYKHNAEIYKLYINLYFIINTVAKHK